MLTMMNVSRHGPPQRHCLLVGSIIATTVVVSQLLLHKQEEYDANHSNRHCNNRLCQPSSIISMRRRHDHVVSFQNQSLLFSSWWWNPSVVHCSSLEQNKKGEEKSWNNSRLRRLLAQTRILSWPIPRILVKGDAIFNNSHGRRKLRQRRRDEARLEELQKRALTLRDQLVGAKDPKQHQQDVNALFHEMCRIAYGQDVTPQAREDFMVRYGCTGWTKEILDSLVQLGRNHGGLVEAGAGHGQWARAIAEHYQQQLQGTNNNTNHIDIILAFDDMTQLPLSPKIYHNQTQPARDYFYGRVEQCLDFGETLQKPSCRGRVLLLVYPPPGPMALQVIQAYLSVCDENDTIVYVGEGRGGANGNDALFDYMESGDWILNEVLPVHASPGNKGFEQYHVLQHIKKQRQQQQQREPS